VIVEVEGASLWTATQGGGVPLVLCHGGPGLSDNLGPIAEMVDDLALVHRYDQRGSGRSRSSGPFDVEAFVADLEALRRRWGHERCLAGGHSWGANLALCYALAHPDRTLGVIYLAGSGRDRSHAEVSSQAIIGRVPFVTGLVLAAGGSKRLGAPKQLLPYGDGTLLDHVLNTARACDFDQLICVIGGAADEIQQTVDLHGTDVVENRHFGEGCSSSIAAALSSIDPKADVLVLMLGDQPGVTAQTIAALLAGRGDAPLAACAYEDGRGHPLAFAKTTFPDLQQLHGDKGVWKLLDRAGEEVIEVPVQGRIPRDVDTDADYRAVLAEARQQARA
jgi:molybdenum cofactor cytidylyltransferase